MTEKKNRDFGTINIVLKSEFVSFWGTVKVIFIRKSKEAEDSFIKL